MGYLARRNAPRARTKGISADLPATITHLLPGQIRRESNTTRATIDWTTVEAKRCSNPDSQGAIKGAPCMTGSGCFRPVRPGLRGCAGVGGSAELDPCHFACVRDRASLRHSFTERRSGNGRWVCRSGWSK